MRRPLGLPRVRSAEAPRRSRESASGTRESAKRGVLCTRHRLTHQAHFSKNRTFIKMRRIGPTGGSFLPIPIPDRDRTRGNNGLSRSTSYATQAPPPQPSTPLCSLPVHVPLVAQFPGSRSSFSPHLGSCREPTQRSGTRQRAPLGTPPQTGLRTASPIVWVPPRFSTMRAR